MNYLSTDVLADLGLVLGDAREHVDGLLDALVDDLHVVERLLANRLFFVNGVRFTQVDLLLNVTEVVETALAVLLFSFDVVTQCLRDVCDVRVGVGEHLLIDKNALYKYSTM